MKEVQIETKKRKNRIAVVGALMVALATIGLITLLVLLINFGASLFSGEGQEREFENLIYPVVMLDPPAFSRAEAADNTMLLKASIWTAVINEGKEKYTDATTGMLIVPVTDIEKYCAQLFGPGITLGYVSFGDVINQYTYLEDQNAYEVPMEGASGLYTPKVYSVTQDGANYYLIVGYIPPGFSWGASSGEEVPDKFMKYTLKKDGNNYYLYAVSEVTEEEIPDGYTINGPTTSSSSQASGSAQTNEAEQEQSSSASSEAA